jgi:3-phytase
MDDADEQVGVIGLEGFAEDREGISIYRTGPRTGYLLISDQQNNAFRIYRREGEPGKPHEHTFLKSIRVTAIESDGSDVTNVPLGAAFPNGLFVAMSNGRVFHYYSWDDIAGSDLKRAPNGIAR